MLCIRTPQEVINYVNEVGFLPLFANEITGFSVEEHVLSLFWWAGDPVQDPWIWREIIARSRQVAYGRFFGEKAGFISKEWMSYFVKYRLNRYDFDARWDDELATHRSKKFIQEVELLSLEIK